MSSNMADIEKLLAEVAAVRQKHEAIWQRTGERFNLFSVLNVEKKEVRICRVINELLSPNGLHDQGDLYLRLFAKDVMKLTDDWSKAKVFREEPTSDDRRMDIVIEAPHHFIIIEAKIEAKDQESQLADYAKEGASHVNTNGNKLKVYYLTTDGRKPTDYSLCNRNGIQTLQEEDVQCISFKKHIIEWLGDCLKQPETFRSDTLRVNISQFLLNVRKFTNEHEWGYSERMMRNEIKEKIYELCRKNPLYLQSAYALTPILDEIFLPPSDKILGAIKKKMNVNHLNDFREDKK